LATIYTSPGFSDERIEIFVGKAEETSTPSEHGVEMVRLPFAEALEAIGDGRIQDAKTVCGLLLARQRDEGA
jgi:hypothetical protein